MSAPAKRTVPESGRRFPASWLMKVVLPAPFGPITACVSPSATSKSMPSLARSAPTRFVSGRPSSIRVVVNSSGAAFEEDHREQEQGAEHDLPVLRPGFQRLLDE